MHHWLNWWHSRRWHWADPFKPHTAPTTNLSEVTHSRDKNRGSYGVETATALKDDIILFTNLSSKLSLYTSGSYKGGTGPSPQQLLKRKLDIRNTPKPTDINNIINASNHTDARATGVSEMDIDPRSSHREDKLASPPRMRKLKRTCTKNISRVSVNNDNSDYSETPVKLIPMSSASTEDLSMTQSKSKKRRLEFFDECNNKIDTVDISDGSTTSDDDFVTNKFRRKVSHNNDTTGAQHKYEPEKHTSLKPRAKPVALGYRRKTLRSKQFLASFQKSCDEYSNYSIKKTEIETYIVRNLIVGNYYKITIVPNPSCSCLHYQAYEGKIVCKHILIVLAELGVPATSDLLMQTTYNDHDRNLLSNLNLRKLSAPEISKYRLQLIPQESTAYLEYYDKKQQAGRRPSCSGATDKHAIKDGLNICLYSRYRSGQFSKPYTFRYCLRKECYKSCPKHSSCKVLPSYLIGNKVDDNAHKVAEREGFTVVYIWPCEPLCFASLVHK